MPTPRPLHEFSDPWLVGYDAHGIQELITASSRPLAMLGASATLRRFDEKSAAEAVHSVFAGGGRGIEVVDGESAAEERRARLVAEFRVSTFGGTMSTASVPLDLSREGASLRWLRQRLALASESCPPPGHGVLSLYDRKADQCADCGIYRAEHRSERRDASGERVCIRCRDMTRAGRVSDLDEKIQSLLDLVEHDEYVAAVSIDGNNLGALFDGLETIEDTRQVSRELDRIFREADARARRQMRRRTPGGLVSLAAGGDDVRLFLPHSQVLDYLDVFMPAIHDLADDPELNPSLRGRLKNLGVGVGIVLADPHLPAKRLMEYAHDLERSAKRRSRPGEASARSALDFAVLTAGDSSRIDPSARDRDDGRPVAFADWDQIKAETAVLAQVPRAQRALLRDAPPPHSYQFAEFKNAWRYQVARSPSWQSWYQAVGANWRDPEEVVRQRPRAIHLDLLHFLQPSPA